jgi:hypothetical protein
MQFKYGVLAAVALMSTGAHAQEAVYYTSAQVSHSADARYLSFPVGTPVALQTRSDISTKEVRAGDRVYLRVAENLVYNDQIVLPAGTTVVAEIAQADRNGHFGVKGKIAINLLYIDTNMGHVAIEGNAARVGKSGTVASVATIALVSPLGFLIHGTSAKIPYGTAVQGYLSQPLKFWGTMQQAQTSPGFSPAIVEPTKVAAN